MNRNKALLTILIIIIVSAGLIYWTFSTEPVAEREGATRESAMLIEVIEAEQGDFRPLIKATGTVQPSKDISLSPRITGEVMMISEDFVPGANVRKGQVLVGIDPSDYENTVALRNSDLQVAQANYQLELGQQEAAENDYKLAQKDVSTVQNKDLVLRTPQLNTAKANMKAAEAQLAQARLNLERTKIKAPFDAHIVSRSVNTGSQVAPGGVLGRLVGLKEFWVNVNVPLSKVSWIDFDSDGPQRNVKIISSAWPANQFRTGELFKLVGALTTQTRFAQVLITVQNPMISQSSDKPALMIGTFVEAQIPAKELKDVVRLDRNYLRKENTVWAMVDGKLNIKNVDLIFEDDRYAYIKGLENGIKIITTNLSTVVEGAAVRTEHESANEPSE